jgi:hypothetical protein
VAPEECAPGAKYYLSNHHNIIDAAIIGTVIRQHEIRTRKMKTGKVRHNTSIVIQTGGSLSSHSIIMSLSCIFWYSAILHSVYFDEFFSNHSSQYLTYHTT